MNKCFINNKKWCTILVCLNIILAIAFAVGLYTYIGYRKNEVVLKQTKTIRVVQAAAERMFSSKHNVKDETTLFTVTGCRSLRSLKKLPINSTCKIDIENIKIDGNKVYLRGVQSVVDNVKASLFLLKIYYSITDDLKIESFTFNRNLIKSLPVSEVATTEKR